MVIYIHMSLMMCMFRVLSAELAKRTTTLKFGWPYSRFGWPQKIIKGAHCTF